MMPSQGKQPVIGIGIEVRLWYCLGCDLQTSGGWMLSVRGRLWWGGVLEDRVFKVVIIIHDKQKLCGVAFVTWMVSLRTTET